MRISKDTTEQLMKTPTIRKILENLRWIGRYISTTDKDNRSKALDLTMTIINDLTARQEASTKVWVKYYKGEPVEILTQGALQMAQLQAKQPGCEFQVKKVSITIEG